MFLNLLFSSPAIAVAWVIAIFASLTVHEFSHALVASLRGDRTAEREGRLTLNPLAHLDPLGFIMLLVVGFGWAKPVPYNPYNLKDPKWDSVAVALAGPASNFLVALVCGLLLRSLITTGAVAAFNLLPIFLFLLVLLNLFLMVFNLLPIVPLDGSRLFFALFSHPKYARLREFMAFRGQQILLFLLVLSCFTSFDVFFFVTAPALFVCDQLIGGSCLGFYAQIFSLF
jgi:Zn-dependent protease